MRSVAAEHGTQPIAPPRQWPVTLQPLAAAAPEPTNFMDLK